MALVSDSISNCCPVKENEKEKSLSIGVFKTLTICNRMKTYINGEVLTVLELEDLSLEELPQELPDLFHLNVINLSGNKLCALPMTLVSARKLRVLNLARNQFEMVPKCLISGLLTLKKIDFSENFLRDFNVPPACLPLLKELLLAHNLLTEVPEWLLYDYSFILNVLDLSFNPCFYPKKYLKVPSKSRISGIVRTLKLINTNFTVVSLGFFLHFPSLLSLDLSNNPMTSTRTSSFSVEHLPSELEELFLKDVDLQRLPDLRILKKLKILNVSTNSLDWLPDENSFAPSLRTIDLSHTKLLILPNYIGNLTFLTCLMLSDNKMESLPNSFDLLINLEVLDLYNNALITLPQFQSFQKLRALDLWMNYFEPPMAHSLVEGTIHYEELKNALRETYNFRSRLDNVKVEEVFTEDDIIDRSSYSTSPESSCFLHIGVPRVSESPKSSEKVEEIWDSADDEDVFDPTANNFHLDRVYKEILNRDFGIDCLKFCPEDIRNSPHLFQPFEERSNSSCWIRQKEKMRSPSSVVDGQFDDD